MLRYTLEGGKWTTIEKEFIFLEKYCNLQQMRLQEKLTFVVEYDKEIKDFIIPKLLLQPVVENSIIHGIEPIEGLCELIISAKKTNENIVDIIIKDTGTGFDVNEISNNSVGLANIKERLLLAYQDASIDIKSQISEGTTIEIKIPMEGERK
jgi:two-component system sensor histidine kinase YesM